jgi:hypothetical protein
MVTLKRKSGPITRTVIVYSHEPRFDGSTTYFQCFRDERPFGYRKERWTTLAIDLSRSDDDLLGDMNKTTRTHVKQVAKQDPVFGRCESIDRFLEFYNEFASQKDGVSTKRRADLEEWGDALEITQVSLHDEVIAMHSYVVDPEESRARLLQSGSIRFFANEEINANLIGKANRYHHWADIKHFQERGIKTYDFGGYAKDSADPLKANIATFKAGFGGTEETFYHYTPWWIVLGSKLKG